jgi:hypothetical protein
VFSSRTIPRFHIAAEIAVAGGRFHSHCTAATASAIIPAPAHHTEQLVRSLVLSVWSARFG